MAEDIIRAKGSTKATKPDAGGANPRNVPVLAIVKDNVDPTRSGKLKVYIGDKGGPDSDNSNTWVSVNYMTTFFGKVIPQAGSDGYGDYKNNPSSYGEWHAPPDIGTTVICIFINGDPNYGFYIGCVPDADALQMVPAIGATDNIIPNEGEAQSYGGAVRLPVTNINTNNDKVTDSPDFITAPKPVHSYTASIMNQQGVIRDPIRGPISSSAQREAASRVGWGVSTPGRPIYSGGYNDTSVASNLTEEQAQKLKVVARRGGHSFVMDDGDVIGRDQLIRIRTALGHQILMSDDGQTLMILHSNGQSYIELGKEGTIDMYSTNSVNIRTQGDLNLHADNNINLHAVKDMNFKATNFNVNTDQKIALGASTDIQMSAINNFTAKAGAAVALASGGDGSLAAGGAAYINGSKVNLNSGSASTQPEQVATIPVLAQTDTLYDQSTGFSAAPGKLLSITSRAPAHAPWANAGQGVNVQTNLDANANLPPTPSPAVASANDAGASTNPTPVSVATAASAPNVPAVSDSMDQGTTNAVLGAQAQAAAQGPLAAATQQGAAVISTAAGNVAAVGAFAQSPSQLASSGILKPGSDTLINGLVQSGANISQAMPSALFAGAPGAKNLQQLTSSVGAQATSVVTNMQQAQTGLTLTGVITGRESPTQVAGLVNAATTVGLNQTVGAVQSISGGGISTRALTGAVGSVTTALTGSKALGSLAAGATGLVSSALGSAGGAITTIGTSQSALGAIGSGAAAAGVATLAGGGLGGIASGLNAMAAVPSLTGLLNLTQGVSGSAFNAIKKQFKPMQAGIPQNLTQIAAASAVSSALVSGQGTAGSLLAGVAGGVAGGLAGNAVKGLVSGSSALGVSSIVGGSVGSLVSGALNSVSGLTSATSIATGSLGSVNNITGAINNSVPGVSGLATQVSSSLGSIPNPLNSSSASVGAIGGITGLISKTTGINPTNPGGILSVAQKNVNGVTALGGAGASLATGGLAQLSASASIINSGAGASASSALASGMSNLPGGIGISGAVVNNAPNAINSIPGAGQLSGLIGSAQTAAMNGLPMPSIPGGLGSLSSLASTGLSVGDAASLQSSISALSSGTAGAIQLPTFGFNTTDRSSISDQITSVLGDPSIPPPDLTGEISTEAVNDIQALDNAQQQAIDIEDQLNQYQDVIDAANTAYENALATLPEGDPGIESARQAWLAALSDPGYIALLNQYNADTNVDIPSIADASQTASSTNSSANETTINGLIASGASSASGLTGSLTSSIPSVSSLSNLTSLSGTSSLTSLVNNPESLSSLTSTSGTALGTVTGQNATALESLQGSVASNTQEINNSISGIIGPGG
jgi:hypothetical protein